MGMWSIHVPELCFSEKNRMRLYEDSKVSRKRIREGIWRARGPVGKLHNMIKYIRWTPQRREQFAGIRIGGELAKFDKLEVGYLIDDLTSGRVHATSPFVLAS